MSINRKYGIILAVFLVYSGAVSAGKWGELLDKAKDKTANAAESVKNTVTGRDDAEDDGEDPVDQSSAGVDAGYDGEGVKRADIAGVRLGMSLRGLVAALEKSGHDVRKRNSHCIKDYPEEAANPCFQQNRGVTLKRITGDSEVPGGWSELTIRVMNNKVYFIRKEDSFLSNKLPESETEDHILSQYKELYMNKFSGARFHQENLYNRPNVYAFDDEMAPPYDVSKNVVTPHARFSLSGGGRGRFTAVVEMHWKDSVGVDW